MSRGKAIEDKLPIGPGVRALNPRVFGRTAVVGTPEALEILKAGLQPEPPKKPKISKPRQRQAMNKLEQAYADLLDAQVRRGEIVSWEREGITLRWADGMTYTPDFTVVTCKDEGRRMKDEEDGSGVGGTTSDPAREALASSSFILHPSSFPCVALLFIETKGPRIEEDALVKFRSARDKWGRFYRFEMWQRASAQREWTKLL